MSGLMVRATADSLPVRIIWSPNIRVFSVFHSATSLSLSVGGSAALRLAVKLNKVPRSSVLIVCMNIFNKLFDHEWLLNFYLP